MTTYKKKNVKKLFGDGVDIKTGDRIDGANLEEYDPTGGTVLPDLDTVDDYAHIDLEKVLAEGCKKRYPLTHEIDDWRTQLLRDRIKESGELNFKRAIVNYKLGNNACIDEAYFNGNTEFLEFAQERLFDLAEAIAYVPYVFAQSRLPRMYESNEALYAEMRHCKDLYTLIVLNGGKRIPHKDRKIQYDVKDMLEIIAMAGAAYTFKPMPGGKKVIQYYDYDQRRYRSDADLVFEWVRGTFGAIKLSFCQDLIRTLEHSSTEGVFYNPLPPFCIPVKNGIYNALNKKLMPDSPVWTNFTRVNTNYNPDAEEPDFPDEMTFDKMLESMADGNEATKRQLQQACKSVMIGKAPGNASVYIIGDGGDGKSTLAKLMSYIVGGGNTGNLTLRDFSNSSKLLEATDKVFVYGDDNDGHQRVPNIGVVKAFCDHNPMSVDRKYLEATQIQFNGVMWQLMNEAPGFFDATEAIRRRFVMIRSYGAHTIKGDVVPTLEDDILDTKWQEYILKYLLDDVPFFTEFERGDESGFLGSLLIEDTIARFLNEMEQRGVIGGKVTVFPQALMYSLYRDWVEEESQGGKSQLGSRSFSRRIIAALSTMGYRLDMQDEDMSIKAILATKGAPPLELIRAVGDTYVTKCLRRNRIGGVFVKVEADHRVPKEQRYQTRSEDCTAFEFYRVGHYVWSMVRNHPALFVDLAEKFLPEFAIHLDPDRLRDFNLDDAPAIRDHMANDESNARLAKLRQSARDRAANAKRKETREAERLIQKEEKAAEHALKKATKVRDMDAAARDKALEAGQEFVLNVHRSAGVTSRPDALLYVEVKEVAELMGEEPVGNYDLELSRRFDIALRNVVVYGSRVQGECVQGDIKAVMDVLLDAEEVSLVKINMCRDFLYLMA